MLRGIAGVLRGVTVVLKGCYLDVAGVILVE